MKKISLFTHYQGYLNFNASCIVSSWKHSNAQGKMSDYKKKRKKRVQKHNRKLLDFKNQKFLET